MEHRGKVAVHRCVLNIFLTYKTPRETNHCPRAVCWQYKLSYFVHREQSRWYNASTKCGQKRKRIPGLCRPGPGFLWCKFSSLVPRSSERHKSIMLIFKCSTQVSLHLRDAQRELYKHTSRMGPYLSRALFAKPTLYHLRILRFHL